ncbi:MAG: peptidoglycan DD-metalloendopeptidase family protein [Deltaproteobacteria bacterium]|nr:peptidoglycan DD-metalloendopeptidase family protein [Deltaproteobacteria bacterium]
MGRRRGAVFIFTWGLLLWTAFPGQALGASSPAEPSLSDLKKQERSIIAQLDQIDQQLNRFKVNRRRLAGELKELNRRQDEARLEARQLLLKEAPLKDRIRRRLKALYLHGQAGFVRLYLAGPWAGEAAFGQAALARMVKFDLELIKDYNKLRQELKQAQESRAARKTQIETLAQRLKKAQAQLAEQRRARAALLLKVGREQKTYEQALAELNRAAAALNQELAAVEEALSQGPARGRLAQSKGRLPWPVAGRLERMSQVKRRGVLIRTEEGRPVKAVGAGRVVHAGWVKGYGLVVIIDHGARYYTLSAHLEELKIHVGQDIEAGQVLGLSGLAGLAQPGVYFEIRHRDKALDPAKWLAGATG